MAGGLRYSTLGAQMADLQIATADRLVDAEALVAAGRFASAVAMGIYALEIQLKVLICKRLNITALSKAFEIHELASLLVLSGHQAALASAPADVQFNWQKTAYQSLQINNMRYTESMNWTKKDAESFFQQLRDAPNGVLPWLLSQS